MNELTNLIDKEEEGRLERGKEKGKGTNKRQSNKMYIQHSLLSHGCTSPHSANVCTVWYKCLALCGACDCITYMITRL